MCVDRGVTHLYGPDRVGSQPYAGEFACRRNFWGIHDSAHEAQVPPPSSGLTRAASGPATGAHGARGSHTVTPDLLAAGATELLVRASLARPQRAARQ